MLSQYQASYPAILDIATYVSLNKLLGFARHIGKTWLGQTIVSVRWFSTVLIKRRDAP